MFYDFKQNNSGGSFDFDWEDGISVHVVIEADTPDEANHRAEDMGLYFNGCADGRDCNCCGDRWNTADEYEEKEYPHAYGEYIEDFKPLLGWMLPDPEVFVHYKDGVVVPYVFA